MAWTNIPDSDVDAESPLTESLAKRWRDNPEAVAGGLPSVPYAKKILAPQALRTDDLDTTKRLGPDGTGGMAFYPDQGAVFRLTGSGTWVPPFTGNVRVQASGGGGQANGRMGGGAGVRVDTVVSVTAGSGISYSVGLGAAHPTREDGQPTTFGSVLAPGGTATTIIQSPPAAPPDTPGGLLFISGIGDPVGNFIRGGRNSSSAQGANGLVPGAGGNAIIPLDNSDLYGGEGAVGYLYIQYLAP